MHILLFSVVLLFFLSFSVLSFDYVHPAGFYAGIYFPESPVNIKEDIE